MSPCGRRKARSTGQRGSNTIGHSFLVRIAETTTCTTWAKIADEMGLLTLGTFTGPVGTFRQTAELTKAQAGSLARCPQSGLLAGWSPKVMDFQRKNAPEPPIWTASRSLACLLQSRPNWTFGAAGDRILLRLPARLPWPWPAMGAFVRAEAARTRPGLAPAGGN